MKVTGGIAQIQATQWRFLAAVPGAVEGDGREMMILSFGEELDEAEFVALTIEDAQRLRSSLGEGLASPVSQAALDSARRRRHHDDESPDQR